MTCVVGIKIKDNVFLGADRMASNGFTGSKKVGAKVFRNGEFIFGTCGSMRIENLMQYCFTAPDRAEKESDLKYLNSKFSKAVHELFKNNGGLKTVDGEDRIKGEFLFAYRNELYLMQSDFSIYQSDRDYEATGSGEYHALASLYSTEGQDLNPIDRIKKAIVCASEFVLSVDSNIDILSLNEKKD